MSREEFDKIIPVSPPIVKRKIKPKVQYKEASREKLEPEIVATQLKTLTPVGIAITIVAAVK
jgi:hypothetical protein